ncbi:hypothetical protein Mapa_009678 [Marchantia paleacea]|nr:hypothetical protein Mapa_009678 [Marchantia paleacea]
MTSTESLFLQRRGTMGPDVYYAECANRLRDLVGRLDHISAEDNSVEYENVVRMCVEQAQGIHSIKMQLTGLKSREAETLLEVLKWADVSELRELDLSRTFITGSVVQSVAEVLSTERFAALEVLDLSHNLDCVMDMTSSVALAEVLSCGFVPHLRVLGLPPCHVPTIAAAMLKGNMSRLEELRMQFNRKLMQSSFELRSFFKQGVLSALRILDLSDCSLTEDQIEQLTSRIKSGNLVKLEYLDLSYNFLRSEGSASLGRAIRSGQLPLLRHLDLNWCNLGNSGVQQILDWIDRTPLLEFLSLKNNSISDIGTAALAQVMKVRKLVNIREIRLGGKNMITNQGIVALARVLSDPRCVPKLHTLDLGDNKTLEFIGARAVANAYRQNPNLTVFVNVSWPSESLNIRTQEQRLKNKRTVEIKLELQDEEEVAQCTAKVFLCGFERVGKTTLRRSMERQVVESLLKWERRPRFHDEPRTRGIELSSIRGEPGTTGEKLTLILWDLAGQQEFHVMHGTFLPDLGLASGKATTFVLVFRASVDMLPTSKDSESELRYWLRFIAAGSVKGVKRHLVVALNCIDSQKHGGFVALESHVNVWRGLLKDLGKVFSDLIDIHLEPFVLDARTRRSVQELKQHLLTYVGSALKEVKIPKVCVDIHEFLLDWKKEHSTFPVLNWTFFSRKMKERGIGSNKLDAAAAHLQESGYIIYYRNSLVEGKTDVYNADGFVVADPEWFGRKVIGQILLPKHMLAEGESSLPSIVGDDGSLKRSILAEHFHALITDNAQTDELIGILAKLGLCYNVGKEKVFIPALIREDNLSMWERVGVHWVMGRSLQPRAEDKGFIPLSVFRKMQVLLAQDKRFGLRGDSEYCAGKTFSSFMVGSQIVLVQFDVDESNPEDDRIDVLVKHRVDLKEVEVQYHTDLDVVLEIMDMVERLCVQSCPGVDLERMAIGPWYARDPTVPMAERKLMSVAELKMRVREHGLGKYTSLRVGEEGVREDQLLSTSELEAIHSTVNQRLLIAESDIVNFDLLPPSSLRMEYEMEEALKQQETQGDVERVIAVVREEHKRTREHIDRRMAELHEKFNKAFEHQKTLLNQILALNSYSIEEKERSYPRYIFLAKACEPSVYLSARQAFHERFRMHLLCESRYMDGVPHHVEKQEGFEMKSSREWLRRVAPWLIWSLKVTIVVARIVGGIFAPGIGILIPDFEGGDSSKLAESVEKLAMEVNETLSKDNISSPKGTVSQLAATVVSQKIKEVGPAVFDQKIGLRRVALTSRESDPYSVSVVWMCKECFDCYIPSGRVRDITSYD